jgi:hypothetical protein
MTSTGRLTVTLGLACGLLAASSLDVPEHSAPPHTGLAVNTSTTRPPRAAVYSPIVELRQYTLHPGRRDDLIRMFDANFVEPQEAAGIKVIGQFRDLGDPNRFVWVRGFPDMESRARSLETFYSGSVWRSWRAAANATMIDSDNVLLLHPVNPQSGFTLDDETRSAVSATGAGAGVVIATIYHLDPTAEKERDFVGFFARSVAPVLADAGAPVIAAFVPERSPNTFPGLPVREGEHVFVWFSRFPSKSAYERFQRTLSADPRWRDSVAVELGARVREPHLLRLSPTVRSLLHG